MTNLPQQKQNMPRPCFMPFCFNTPYQFAPLLNLRSPIFGLTAFSWFICIYLSLFYYGSTIFDLHLFDLHPLFQECN
jgi:hypothetical protein